MLNYLLLRTLDRDVTTQVKLQIGSEVLFSQHKEVRHSRKICIAKITTNYFKLKVRHSDNTSKKNT